MVNIIETSYDAWYPVLAFSDHTIILCFKKSSFLYKDRLFPLSLESEWKCVFCLRSCQEPDVRLRQSTGNKAWYGGGQQVTNHDIVMVNWWPIMSTGDQSWHGRGQLVTNLIMTMVNSSWLVNSQRKSTDGPMDEWMNGAILSLQSVVSQKEGELDNYYSIYLFNLLLLNYS